MGDLIKPKTTPSLTVEDVEKKQKSTEFYQELDTYRKKGAWWPVLLLVIVTVALFVFVGWYLRKTGGY